jgi:hypothetical protein
MAVKVGDTVRIVNSGYRSPPIGTVGLIGKVLIVHSDGAPRTRATPSDITARFKYSPKRRKELDGSWGHSRMEGIDTFVADWVLNSNQYEIILPEPKNTALINELKNKSRSPVEDFILFGLEESEVDINQ